MNVFLSLLIIGNLFIFQSNQDCSSEDLRLFESHCLPGPFGGQVSPAPDYQCSVQSSENSPDWFPFLCVSSPPENNPYLGLFYQGDTMWEIIEYKFLFLFVLTVWFIY